MNTFKVSSTVMYELSFFLHEPHGRVHELLKNPESNRTAFRQDGCSFTEKLVECRWCFMNFSLSYYLGNISDNQQIIIINPGLVIDSFYEKYRNFPPTMLAYIRKDKTWSFLAQAIDNYACHDIPAFDKPFMFYNDWLGCGEICTIGLIHNISNDTDIHQIAYDLCVDILYFIDSAFKNPQGYVKYDEVLSDYCIGQREKIEKAMNFYNS